MSEQKDKKPVAYDVYEEIAERYAEAVVTKPYNAYYERPALLSLLPDVAGKRVLDAGCGPGIYSAWLVDHGARVVAVDVSPKMVRLTKERLASTVEARIADLSKPLDFVENGSFDVVLSPLVLHYIEDWTSLLKEVHRILCPSGVLVFSTHHPFMDFFATKRDDYFTTEILDDEWSGFGEPVKVRYYRRPLSAIFAALSDAGFVVEQLVEPRPVEEMRCKSPETFEKLSKRPWFLCIRAAKAGAM